MRYNQLGRTGLRVSAIGLGTASFGEPLDEAEGCAVVERALDGGINLIDTANAYARGRSEEIVGKAIAGRRADIVLATKVFGAMGDGPNDRGTSRAHVFAQADASLQRLGTDYIDLYFLHQPDPATPIEESLGALDDLVRSGKVRYAALSNFYPVQLSSAFWAGERGGHHPIACEQAPYHLFDRRIERELAGYCHHRGIGLMTYNALAQGALSGRYDPAGEPPADSRCARSPIWREWFGGLPRSVVDSVERVRAIAEDAGVPLPPFALAWALARGPAASHLVGPRTPAQVDDLLAALEVTLDDATLARVDEICPPGGFAWF